MSNFLAIAMVTETLRHLLAEAAGRAVPGVNPTVGRPQAPGQGSDGPGGVNIFAYQVNPNTAWSNSDLPTRATDGRLTRRPRIAFNIDYLLSFRGPETQLVPERLLGSCVSMLHARPVLTRDVIQRTIDAVLENDADHFLGGADLANQVDRVKLTPLPLNLEELSKLWSVFFQIPYMLSVAYQASAVLIEEELEPAAPALPVRDRRVFVQPFRRIRIESVQSGAGPDEPIHADGAIRILGDGLGGGTVEVNIAGATLASTQVTAREVRVDLSTMTNPRAGILPLRVAHRVSEDAPQLRFESNVVALALAPRIEALEFTPAAGDEPATADIELFPPVAARQIVRLFLNPLQDIGPDAPATPRAYVFESEPASERTAETSVSLPGVEPATYLARVQIDGAESPLVTDDDQDSPTFGRYIGPTLQVT